jgi:hypothetical protein
MTLDKRHMAGSVLMLAGAIAYNVWVFTRPATRVAAAAPPVDIMGASSTGTAGGEGTTGMDLAAVPVLPDVQIDRSPTWPRDPFDDQRAVPAVVEAAPAAPVRAVEPDPVVASILYSTGRRLAVIDGRIVRTNDRVGSATVVDILPKAVVLEFADGVRHTVELQAPTTGRRRGDR